MPGRTCPFADENLPPSKFAATLKKVRQEMERLKRRWTQASTDERRKDAHEKIQLGGLVAAAGLRDYDPMVILGALVELKSLTVSGTAADANELFRLRKLGVDYSTARRANNHPDQRPLMVIFPGPPLIDIRRKLRALGLSFLDEKVWQGTADRRAVELAVAGSDARIDEL